MLDVREVKATLSKLVNQLETAVPYADALYSENTCRSLTKDKTGIEANTSADAGVKLRAFDGTQFHEICLQGWQPSLLQSEVQALCSRLKNKQVAGKTLTLKVERDILEKDFATSAKIDPSQVPVKEKAAVITQLHEQVLSWSKEFINVRVAYREEEEKRIFVNRYRKLSSKWVGCMIIIMPFVQTPDGQTRNDHQSWFANGFEVRHVPEAELKHFLERALKIKSAGRITPGKYTAILSPVLSGLLAHESFGHGMESDTIMKGRAKAEEFLGKKIASAKVSICDDPSLPMTHGFFFFDDEGVIPKRTTMVKSGIVGDPISESYSAAKKGYVRNGNARAASFERKIYARMSNTFFLPGKEDIKLMIKDVKKGIYLHTASSGMEDPKGWGVQIAGIICETIKNGKLTGEYFYEASISGYLPTILANITAISKDFEVKDSGYCGKGHKEMVRVSSGGPHITIKELDLS